MRNDDDDRSPPLSPQLADAISHLREEPEVRAEWVASVVDAAASQPIGDDDAVATLPRRWSFRPSVAIAAGVVFALAGAAAGRLLPRPDVNAQNSNSIAAEITKNNVRFSLVAPGAVNVTLVGDFNAWNPTALPMRKSRNGDTWEVEVGLAPGRYTYSFVVDGRLARDPSAAEAARDDFGVPSSVLLVKGT